MQRENFDCDYNAIYWIGRTTAGSNIVNHNAATPNRTWTQWITTGTLDGATHTGQEAHSVFGSDPLFVNAAAGDWSLDPASPAIDAGATLPPAGRDRLGILRPQAAGYDMGAFELVGAGPDVGGRGSGSSFGFFGY